MLFKNGIGLVLTATLMLLAGAVTVPRAAAQDPQTGNPPANNPASETAATETAAIEKEAKETAALEEARKEADAKAEKKALVQAEFEKTPLTVTRIDPFVERDEKGQFAKDGKPLQLGKAGMGDRIAVVISRLSQAVEYEVIDPAKLVLFIDGRVFKDVHPDSIGWDTVVFKLERTKDAIDAWNGLLGSPRLDSTKPIVVSVGYPDQKPLRLDPVYEEKPNLDLIVYRKRWAVASLIGLILVLLVFWKKGGTDLLRDAGPPKPEPGKRPYSLAKVQVAWWFFLVVGCFLLIYLITGEYTMTEQALILIGIGTGTALGSAMIDSSKRDGSNSELDTLNPELARLDKEIEVLKKDIEELDKRADANKKAIAADPAATETQKESLKSDQDSSKAKTIELSEKQAKRIVVNAKIEDAKTAQSRPISEGVWSDLVTDANGPSFHRFQMIAWTVILGILFLAGVYKNLAMPEFSGTMLALMGISAGTYLGFKIPEKQNTAEEIAKAKADADAKAKADAGAAGDAGAGAGAGAGDAEGGGG